MALADHLPPELLPVFDALDAAEAGIRQDRLGHALAHLAALRIMLQIHGLTLNAPPASAQETARALALVAAVEAEAAEVVDLAARRARLRGHQG